MINAYVLKNRLHTGQGRYLKSLESTGLVKLYTFDSIDELSSLYNIEKANAVIVGSVLPNELWRINHDKIYYCFTSPIIQADLSSYDREGIEIEILYYVLEQIRLNQIKGCILSSESLAFATKLLYVPPICCCESIISTDRRGYGFMGNNTRKHKNSLNQLIAMSKLTPKEPIIINSDIVSPNFQKNFDCDIKSLGLLTDDQYFKEISSHRLGFQVSLSESFCFQTYEYAMCGVPNIVSPVINHYPFKECVVNNIDSVKEIYIVAQKLLNDKELYDEISQILPSMTSYLMKENKERAIKVLQCMNI